MNETAEIIKILRQAFKVASPDCEIFFDDTDGYLIIFKDKNMNRSLHWKNSDAFLFGDRNTWTCSIWKTMENIVYYFNNNVDTYVRFFHKYPGVLQICQIASKSSSAEELKLKLTIAGILT